jgi:sulfur carrier protein ThiS
MKIRTVGYAERLLGFKEREITFDGEKPLMELLSIDDFPSHSVIILVNGDVRTKDVHVKNEDKVVITQLVAGG